MDDSFTIRTFWLAGELARAVGVSRDTLRHYERKGVLPRPRRAANGYRLYPENALKRVLLVRRALAVGFTLDELARILTERDAGGAPCREVRQLAVEKLSDVEGQLTALTALRDELQAIIAEWNARLSGGTSDAQAGLLESLVATFGDENNSALTAKHDKAKLSPRLKIRKKGSKR